MKKVVLYAAFIISFFPLQAMEKARNDKGPKKITLNKDNISLEYYKAKANNNQRVMAACLELIQSDYPMILDPIPDYMAKNFFLLDYFDNEASEIEKSIDQKIPKEIFENYEKGTPFLSRSEVINTLLDQRKSVRRINLFLRMALYCCAVIVVDAYMNQ